MDVSLRPWQQGDLGILELSNTAEMTTYLGGPESAADLAARHALYLGFATSGDGAMFRLEADGEAIGYAGWWAEDHEGMAVYEVGCAVLPSRQGGGVATEALRQIVRLASAVDGRTLVGYAAVGNEASNALCRRVGFELRGAGAFPSDEGDMLVNIWMLEGEGR